MKQKRVSSLIRTLLFCALGVILLLLSYFCFEGFILDYINRLNHQAVYFSTSGYAEALGVDRFSYDAFIKAYGEPDSTQYWVDPEFSDRELLSLSYRDFDVPLFGEYIYERGNESNVSTRGNQNRTYSSRQI